MQKYSIEFDGVKISEFIKYEPKDFYDAINIDIMLTSQKAKDMYKQALANILATEYTYREYKNLDLTNGKALLYLGKYYTKDTLPNLEKLL